MTGQWLSRLRALARNLLRRSSVDRDLDAELKSYVELSADEAQATGVAPDAALRQARLRLGGTAAVTESVRSARAAAGLERLWQDLRYAMRTLLRAPGYTVGVVLTLALSLGLATAVFAVVYDIRLRPLPVGRPDEVMALFQTSVETNAMREPVAGARFNEWRRRNEVFTGMAAASRKSFDFPLQGVGARVEGELVSADFFQVLRVEPRLGRVFMSGDMAERVGTVPCVIAESLWRRVFEADAAVVGRTFQANGVSFTVIGVVPDAFARWRQPAEIWAPYDLTPTLLEPRILASDGYRIFRVFGRLRPGIGPRQADAAIATLDPQIQEFLHGDRDDREGVAVVPLKEAVSDPAVTRSLWLLSGAALLVLCLAAANIAGLTLIRNVSRAREFATRLALGGSVGRLAAQLATEGALLLAFGTSIGLFLGRVALPVLVALAPPDAARAATIATDGPVLLFALAIALVTAAAIGVTVAMRARHASLGAHIRPVPGATQTPASARAQALLVLIQGMMAVPVVAASALLVTSVVRLEAIDLGFEPRGLHIMKLNLPASIFPTTESLSRFQDELTRRASTVPAIAEFAITDGIPVNFFGGDAPIVFGSSITIEGGRRYLNAEPADAPLAPNLQRVTPGYFRALGVPVLRGRDFRGSDRPGAPLVAIVNETMARLNWPGGSPIGKRVNFERVRSGRPLDEPWTEIIGVVADARRYRLDAPPRPEIYVPFGQKEGVPSWFFVHARGRAAEGATASALRDLVRSVDPRVPIGDGQTVPEMIANLTATPRYSAALLALFSLISLTLAAVGTYGLGAFAVAQRRREIGIRLALGATPRDVARFIAVRGLLPAACGLVIGAVLARATSGILQGLVFGVEPSDPLIFAAALGVLVTVAALAAYLPARRATRINPVETLRAE